MITALVGGEVDLSITDTASLASYVKSGQVRVLATSSPTRLPGYPDLPTLKELGIPYELVAWHGVFVRRGTPPEVVARLTELVKVAARSPEFTDYVAASGLDNFLLTGDEAVKYMDADIKRWSQITHDAGVVPN
jgi:tripartite-type tricarboxylate transporter receptor subunit TctC